MKMVVWMWVWMWMMMMIPTTQMWQMMTMKEASTPIVLIVDSASAWTP